MVATCGESLKLAATVADQLCNKLQVKAGSGDKSVLSSVLAAVDLMGNDSI
jgi:hypothetical protein